MPQDTFRIFLVHKGDNYYEDGRKIATNAYCKAWQTENLDDENDFGVVIYVSDRPAANINLQLKKETNLIKSEKFYSPEHWFSSFQLKKGIAELSALAIEGFVPFKQRPSIFKALILGVQSLCHAHSIQLLATIQHRATIKLFADGLGLKLIKNQTAKINQANIPNDNYWRRSKFPPALYYLSPADIENQAKCANFFSELQLVQEQTIFVNRLKPTILAGNSTFKNQLSTRSDRYATMSPKT